MDYLLFVSLYNEALSYNDVDMYVAERGWQSWLDEYPDEKLGPILQKIFDLAHGSLADNRETSRAQFSRDYSIPLRTLEDWDSGRRLAPDYVKSLIDYTLFLDWLDE